MTSTQFHVSDYLTSLASIEAYIAEAFQTKDCRFIQSSVENALKAIENLRQKEEAHG